MEIAEIAENVVGTKIPITLTIQIRLILVIQENQKEEGTNSKFLILGQE